MDCSTAEKSIHLYITRELDGEHLEEFLDHIQHCPSCSEELEVHYSIYYALNQMETDDDDVFDMKELLHKDMNDARAYLAEEDNKQFMHRFTKGIALVVLILILGICLEAFINGGFRKTQFMKLFQQESIVIPVSSETDIPEEETEIETNHKKQVIVRTPETEKKEEPKMLPDET